MTREATKIIIVDDDTSMSQAIERLLDASGLECRSFLSAEDLLDSGAFTAADVLILDIQLPGISGLELMRRLKASGITHPIIIITGNDSTNNRELATRFGASAYFSKPFNGAELINAIRENLPAG